MSPHCKPARLNRAAAVTCAVALAVAATAATAACSKTPESATHDAGSMSSESMDHSTMGGMQHMDGMSMTGDTDYDFAANMRTHHQAAVDMSQDELKNGKDPQMLKMAEDIIAAQKKEIAELDQWLAARKKP